MDEPIILLVEDNDDDVALTKRALENSHIGNAVVVVSDGQEALDWLFCTGTYAGRDPCIQPALVLLDLGLPKVSGFDVLRRIRENARTRCLPVVVFATSGHEENVLRSYQLQVNSYIQKPVSYEQFEEAIRQIGAYWLIRNESPAGRQHEEDHGKHAA